MLISNNMPPVFLPFLYPGEGLTPGPGVGTRPIPVTTPPGPGWKVTIPGVGLTGGTIGQSGISQQSGSFGSGTMVQPGATLV